MKKLNLIALVALMFGQCQAKGLRELKMFMIEKTKLHCGQNPPFSVLPQRIAELLFAKHKIALDEQFADDHMAVYEELAETAFSTFNSILDQRDCTREEKTKAFNLAAALIANEVEALNNGDDTGFSFFDEEHLEELAKMLVGSKILSTTDFYDFQKDIYSLKPNFDNLIRALDLIKRRFVQPKHALKFIVSLLPAGLALIFDEVDTTGFDDQASFVSEVSEESFMSAESKPLEFKVYVKQQPSLKALALFKLIDGGVDLHTEGEKYGLPCQFREVMKQPEPATF